MKYYVYNNFSSAFKSMFSRKLQVLTEEGHPAFLFKRKFRFFGRKYALISADGAKAISIKRGFNPFAPKWSVLSEEGELRFRAKLTFKTTTYIFENGWQIKTEYDAGYIYDGEREVAKISGGKVVCIQTEDPNALAVLLVLTVAQRWE